MKRFINVLLIVMVLGMVAMPALAADAFPQAPDVAQVTASEEHTSVPWVAISGWVIFVLVAGFFAWKKFVNKQALSQSEVDMICDMLPGKNASWRPIVERFVTAIYATEDSHRGKKGYQKAEIATRAALDMLKYDAKVNDSKVSKLLKTVTGGAKTITSVAFNALVSNGAQQLVKSIKF